MSDDKRTPHRATRGWPRRPVAVAALATLCACSADETTPRLSPEVPSENVPIQFVVLSDDDGSRIARITPNQLTAWVDFSNRVFAKAGIRFDFNPETGIASLRNTTLNNLEGGLPQPWASAKPIGNELARDYPGKIVVLLRHGSGDQPTGDGFAGTDYAFVVGAGTEDTEHCGHRHDDFLAHELGHYLGLSHTFAVDPFPDLVAAEEHFVVRGRDPGVFDGDRLSDTSPDPAIRPFECQQVNCITLADVAFRLPRRNIMSYYDERDSLSPRQVEIVRWVLAQRLASPDTMRLPVNTPVPNAIEAETMEIAHTRDAETTVQPMDGFGVGDWSGDAQLFCRAGIGGEVTLLLRTAVSIERPVLYATRAPDFAQVRVLIDDQPVGESIDLYAPVVIPSGPIALGDLPLEPGEHRLTIRGVGKNAESTATAFGVDAVGSGLR